MEQADKNQPGVRDVYSGWLVVAGICLALLAWGWLIYRLVPDRSRAWDYGVFPDAPGDSVYSTEDLPRGTHVPRQAAALPETNDVAAAPQEKRQ